MDLRGQRFAIDLSDTEDEAGAASVIPSGPSSFIGDIKERSTAPPTAPQLKTTPSGFPEHKKRIRVSAFKQQRAPAVKPAVEDPSTVVASPPQPPTARPPREAPVTVTDEEERRRIDEENSQRLAAMSAEEIDEEREELMAGLNPSLLERLLKRANLDRDRGDTGIEPPGGVGGDESTISTKDDRDEDIRDRGIKDGDPKDEAAVPAPRPAGKPVTAPKSVRFEDDHPEPTEPTEPTDPIPTTPPQPLQVTQPAMHFPTPPAAPELDPSDPDFLESLHTKYFPNLPADPSKLAWMAPVPTHGSLADQESPYYPNHESLPASALRFEFRGGLLPPRIARAVPTSKGLHHHGEAPEAAGYTIPELARLARSAYPAQRCMAFQTLGRLLYRLGRGEWGSQDGEISKGMWRCIEEGKAIETLEEAAVAEGGHQGSKVYAVEAVWLWQKGGGKRWKAT